MHCPKCGAIMEPMGYGDYGCPTPGCRYIAFNESDEDFCRRLGIPFDGELPDPFDEVKGG